MPSLIPNFEYDIFISYRHKDNKYDGWVTEFVQNLKKELEATFKDDISIYFDENPHDGLLETHDVDDSLKEKLKCLIFIPIISQTYCDPKSFAWRNEFLVFKKLADEDQFGLKLKLGNGNVASRILPVRIHELDIEDKTHLENEIGPLRSIDFIFRSSGVNRPLRAGEDHPNDNLNKTYYRDQVNKVANATKEIITSLKSPTAQATRIPDHQQPKGHEIKYRKSIIAIIALATLIITGYFLYPKIIAPSEKETLDKSIAVLPFKNLDNEVQNQYFADGVMDEILNHLAKIKAIRVVPRTSVEQYRNNRKGASQISEELNVSYLLDGTAQQIAGRIKISVQLIDAKGDRQLWSETFERGDGDIFSIQAEVAQKIAKELKVQITPEEVSQINKIPTSNTKAYDYYLRGKEYNSRFLHSNDPKDFTSAITLQKQAISLDSNFANAYANIGLTFSWAEQTYANPITVNFLVVGNPKYADSTYYYASKALALNPNLPEAFSLMGWYYGMTNQIDQAELNFQKAIELGQLQENVGLGLFYMVRGNFEKTYANWTKTYTTNANLEPIDYTNFGLLYMHIGDLELAKFYHLESIRLQPDFKWGLRSLAYMLAIQGKFDEAYAYSRQLLLFSSSFDDYLNMAHLLGLMKKFDEAEKYLREGLTRMASEYGDNGMEGAYIFWMTNQKEEARKRFAKRMEFCEKAIREKTPYAYKRAAYELASMHSFLGHEKEAYRWLNEYADIGFREGLENYIQIDPLFDPLRNQPEFKIIVDKALASKAELRKRFKLLEKENMLIEQ